MKNLLFTISCMAAFSLNYQDVLKYYGLLCLFCLPVSLATMIYIYRKNPQFIQKVNAKVDGAFGDAPKEPATKKEEKPDSGAEQKKNMSIEEENEEYGIPNLILFIGDKYKCVMSTKNRKDIGGTDMSWHVADTFIGEIKDMQGIFTAKHVGETYIESAVGNKPIYYVAVKPLHSDWYVATVIKDVLDETDINNVKVRNIKERILNLDTENRILEYMMPYGMVKYEYGRDGAVKRSILLLDDKDETRKEICEKIAEYMLPVPANDKEANGTNYWIHKIESKEDDFVDFVAFMKKSKSGQLYVGIGECWRYGSAEDEVTGNPLMVDRSFKKLMAPEDYPAAIGQNLRTGPSEEEINGRKEIEAANNAGKEPEQNTPEEKGGSSNENAGGETTDQEEQPEVTMGEDAEDNPETETGNGEYYDYDSLDEGPEYDNEGDQYEVNSEDGSYSPNENDFDENDKTIQEDIGQTEK